MAFEPSDFEDLIRYLDEHPDVRDQLRRRILSDDFLRLPILVQELGDGLVRLEESQVRLGDAITLLAAAQAKTDASVQVLIARVDKHDGFLMEDRYRQRAPSYFGRMLKRPRVVEADELDLVDAAIARGELDADDFDQLLWLDVLVRGRDKRVDGNPETFFAVEISVTIDTGDVERAIRRADILRRAGYRAFPVVGGQALSDRASAAAEEAGVIVRLAEVQHHVR